MSSQTVVDVVISGTTATVVDAQVDGITTVAGAPQVTNVSGQIPDLGVTTSYLAGQGEILSLTNDIANLRANVIITGQTLTDEIGVLSGVLISTGNYLESNILTLSGDLIASGNNLDSLRDILSGNLITTGRVLEGQIQNSTIDISALQTATGTLQDQKFDKAGGTLSGNVTPSSSGTLSLGTADFPFKSGFFEDLTVSNNTLYVGEIAITATDAGGLDFESASGTTFFKDVSIRNLSVTGTETIIDVDNLAIKDNKIILNSGESGAGISLVTGGIIIDRGTLTDADLLFNEANDRFEFNFPLALEGNLAVTANQTGTYADAGNLITTGQTLTSEINTVSGLINDNDGDITSLKSATGVLKTFTDDNTANLITTGQTLTTNINTVSTNLIATGSVVDDISGNLTTTGQTLTSEIGTVSGLITDNDGDITALKTATGVLKTSTDANTSNLITTGNFLTSEINIVSGLAGGSVIDELSGNLITTGQTLQVQITSNDSDISTLTSNLVTTGQTLTSEIATVSGIAEAHTDVTALSGKVDDISGNLIITGRTLTTDINTVSANLISTGAIIDDVSGNLITTGQTLQTQITSNDGDISTLTSNLITTGQTLTSEIIIVSGLTTGSASDPALSGKVDTLSGNLITTGQTLQTQITSNDGDISTLTTNLITTGQTLQTQITSNDTDISNLTSNVITTGQTLTSEIAIVSGIAESHTDVTALSGKVDDISGNLITTGQTLQTQITSNDGDITTLTSNLITTGQTLTSEIAIVSGIATGGSAEDFAALSGDLITTGQTLQTQITSNDSDISTLTSNLITTGQTLTTDINTVSTNLISTGAVVDDISGNLITTGQTLQTQITSNDSDISTLTSNLISTGSVVDDVSGNLIITGQTLTTSINTNSSNLITTGQTLTSEIAIVSGIAEAHTDVSALSGKVDDISGNLITTGQTLQTQITSNDTDISNLTANLISTGTIVDDISGNLITTGQTLQTQITSNDGDITTLTSNLITTGQTLTSEIGTVSGLITDNDAEITALLAATGELKTDTNTNASNLITTGQTLTTNINTVSTNLVSTGSIVDDISGNLITTGQTLQTQITSNDGDITNLTSNLITTGQTLTTEITTVSGLITDNDGDITALKAATGVLKTSTDNNTANLISTGAIVDDISGNLITSGQTLQTQITSNDSDISTLTTNVITTGQTLQTQITSNDGDISTLTSNLITTGQTLQTQITSNDSDISTLTSNLISTGSVVDDISGNLITTGQTLQAQITSNDSDISTLTSNLVTTGQTLTTNINTVSSNLVSTGSVVDDISGNLITTGQTLQTQITSNDGDISTLTTNLGTTGQTLQTQITSNDADIATLDSTTVKLTTNQSVAGNKIFTDKVTINNLTVTGTEVIVDVENLAVRDNIIHINSGESGAGISRISGGITIDRGTEPAANILYNDANDRFELNFPLATEGNVVASAANLITTGQTLTTNINTVSTNLVSTGSVVDDISGNLITTGQTLQTQITANDTDIATNVSNISSLTTNLVTTGQTLQTQITSNDSDISTLTSNLSTTNSNLVTTGQTLTTNINTVSTNLVSTGSIVDDISGNLITTGQTLQTQITSNDTDITNLSSNLVTTGQTLTTNINTVATNLVTTGQTLTSEIATVSGLIPATVIDGGGTANKVPLWSDANTIGDSVISQSSSKIGIGTATPSAPLHVAVDGTAEILLERTTDLSGMPSQIRIKSAYGSEWALTNNLAGSGKFSIRDVTDSRHVMVFDGDGIVTTNKLEPINGNDSGYLGSSSKKWKQVYFGILEADTAKISGLTNLNGMQYFVTMDSSGNLRKDSRTFLNLTGGTLTGALTGTSATFSGRVVGNDFEMLDSGGTGRTLAVRHSGNQVLFGDGGTFSIFRFNGTQVIPHADSTATLGTNALRWSTIYGDAGNFSGALTVSGGATISGSGTYGALIMNTDTTGGYGLAVESGGTASTRYNLILRNVGGTVVYGGVSTTTGQVGYWGIGVTPTGTLHSRLTINGNASPYINNTYTLGNSTYRWANTYSVLGNFTGALTVGGNINKTGDLTLDVSGDIILDADGTQIVLKDNGTEFAQFLTSSTPDHLYIRSMIQDKDIILSGNDNGSFISALTLDMSDAGTAIFNHDITLPDNGRAVFGAGSDLQIYHNASDSVIRDAGTGRLLVGASEFLVTNSTLSEAQIQSLENGAVTLSYDGSAKLATTSTGVSVTGQLDLSSHLDMPDNAWIKLGASDDLLITHDGSSSWIIDNGAGGLVLASDSFYIKNAAYNETGLSFIENGAVSLYYDNAVKLATTSTGVTVTGALKTTTILDTNNSAGTNGQVLVSTGAAIDWKTLSEISGVDGTGTAGYLSKWTDTDTIGNSPIYTDGTDVAIGSTAFGVGGTQDLSIGNPGTTTGGITLWSTTSATHSLGFGDANSGTARYEGYVEYSHGDNSMRLATSHAERVRITSGGNFGINCTNPATRFAVQHTDGGTGIEFSMGATLSYIQCYSRSASDYKDLKIDAENLRFGTNDGTERMRIGSDGNVGIGTTAPGKLLELAGGGLRLPNGYSIDWNNENTRILASHASGYMRMDVGGTSNVLYLNSSGDVGIGTDAPAKLVDIHHATEPILRLTNTRNWTSSDSGNMGSLEFYTTDASGAGARVISSIVCASNAGSTAPNGELAFSTAVGGGSGTVSTERLRITDDGKVGIGTATPGSYDSRAERLVVHESGDGGVTIATGATSDGRLVFARSGDTGLDHGEISYDQNTDYMGFATAGSRRVTIDNSGKVGIGTTTPSRLFNVYSGSDDTAWIRATYGTTTSVEIGAHSAAAYLSSGTGDDIRISPAGSTRLIIKVDGKIGIGTIAPDNILHVYSSASAMIKLQSAAGNNDIGIDFYRGADLKWEIRNNGNDDSLFFIPQGQNDADTKLAIKSDGNVGIGTTSPEAALTVAGPNYTHAIFRTNQSTASQRAGGGFSSLGHATATSRFARLFLDADGANFSGTDYFTIEKFGNSGEVKFLQYSNATMSFWVNTTTQAMTIKNDGNVGIGTNAPSGKLEVRVASETGTSSTHGIRIGTASNAVNIGASDSGYAWLQTRDADPLSLQPIGGNVGIGIVAPLDLLHLAAGGKMRIAKSGDASRYTQSEYAGVNTNANDGYSIKLGGTTKYKFINDKLGIGSTSPAAPLDVPRASDYKVIKLGDDITSHYVMTGNSDHTLTLTCGSYYQAEIVITANQTNGGTYNNLYIRGIWSNNHTSHHWDEIENVGNLSSSTFTITNGQNGATTNSGEWKIVHDYVSGSFAGMTVRITDFYGTHAYTIS